MTRRSSCHLAGVMLSVILGVSAMAQDVRFESGVTNIHIDALVARGGQPLRGLAREDFVVRDEGQDQPIVAFEEASVPLDLVLAIDISGFPLGTRNMLDYVNGLFASLSRALTQMRPQDRTALLSVGGPRLEQALTSNQKEIAAALVRVRAHGASVGTRSPAIEWAERLLEADAKARGSGAAERKRAILLVTRDFSIVWAPDEPVIRQLWTADVALHAAVVHLEVDPLPLHAAPRLDNPEHIAEATGGDVVHEADKGLPDLLARIQSTYSLWYRAPEAKKGEQRRITVELTPEARAKYPGAEIKARQGYIAQ